MSFDEVLLQLLGLIGAKVLVSVAPINSATSVASMVGILERASASPAHERLMATGGADPQDESLLFRIGDHDRLTLTRSQVSDAGVHEAVAGGGVWLEHGGLMIIVADYEAARQAATAG